ncbi:hypothetical protein SLA2020_184640 [Shorea laevis]
MEKHGSKKMKSSSTSPPCIPRFRSNKNTRPSPITLLERFRETVFRIIMLSALSKSSHTAGSSTVVRPRKYCPADAHHSEAVADCIEFIKKKALTTEENRDCTASSPTVDGAEMVVPVRVVV